MSVSLPTSRITQQMKSAALLGTLSANETKLMAVSQQLSTGNRLSQASDDPAAAVGIMRLNQQLAGNTQYNSNLSFAASTLATADSTLNSMSSMITQAQSIASSMVNTGTTSDERTAQAEVVNSLINQALDYANTQYQGQSIFGGQNTKGSAFISANGGYQYAGTTTGQSMMSPTGSSLEYTLNGGSIFGGLSSQVGGGSDLNASMTNATKLSDLTGARQKGVAAGPVNVTVGGTTISVDLSSAATAGDVVSLVNAGLAGAGSDATIGLSGGSFTVNGDSTQSMTIANATNSTTASDLGIATTVAAGATTTGADVNPKISATTSLASLNNGAGIDPTGFILTNGTSTATISLSGMTSVQDLLNAINNSGTHVTASISADGSGIQIENALSGSALTIGENGGTTATQLGIRSMDTSTKLSSLNQGAGLTLASSLQSGPTGNILVTKTDGTQFAVKMDGISTPSQLIAAINSATGNTTVTAAMNAAGNGITLTDTSGGAGNLKVAGDSNFNSNGSTLGIFSTGTGGTLTDTDMTFSTDDFRVTRQDGTTFSVNLTGATTVQDVLTKINTADGNTGANKVTASLNSTGNGIQLSDASTGSGKLSVTALNSSTAANQLGILKTASSATPGTISGDDTNPVEPQGLFSSLIALRNALLNNDTSAITQAGTMLQQDATRVTTANGLVGAREQDIQSRQSSLSDEQTQLKKSLSLLKDTDETTAITQFQTLQTAYQAAMQVAQTTQNLSLLDFIK